VFHPLPADPSRTQTGAGTTLPDTAGAHAAGFRAEPPLMHGAGDFDSIRSKEICCSKKTIKKFEDIFI
jgi:hypothetical protein